MLVPSMNHHEIAAQIKKEYEKICKTTLPRVIAEYDRERRKLKINKEAFYPREYAIKTAGKNNWIIFIHKSPGSKRYRGIESISYLAVIYYYSNRGLTVYYQGSEQVLAGFTSHFFKRYNERLGLNLSNPIDIVKAFFRKGVYCNIKIVKRDDKPHVIAFGVDGVRFGEIKYDFTYVEWKTFINREITFRQQQEWEYELAIDVMRQLDAAEKKDAESPFDVRSLRNRVAALSIPSRCAG
jgi:hypothetical protein